MEKPTTDERIDAALAEVRGDAVRWLIDILQHGQSFADWPFLGDRHDALFARARDICRTLNIPPSALDNRIHYVHSQIGSGAVTPLPPPNPGS